MNGRASTRLQLAATFLFAVLVTAGMAIGSAVLRPGPACVGVLIASSQEKFGMLSAFAAQYNLRKPLVAGHCVTVNVEQVNSGDAELALETGWAGQAGRPDVWSPASSAWVHLLAYRSPTIGAGLLPITYQILFQSPLVIGMPEPMADALGYPKAPIGWGDILKLVHDPGGWGLYGHGEWGKFLLGKTNPTVSTSGLHALVGTYFAATGGSLTVAAVNDHGVNDFVKGVESSVVHYGETAAAFLRDLRYADDRGLALSYISAIAVEEQELVQYNKGIIGGVPLPNPPTVKLVAIYPSEGTPVADHPYVTLAGSTLKAMAAQSFYSFLQEPANQKIIDANGFRTIATDHPSLGMEKFVDLGQPSRIIPSPDGNVLGGMLTAWQGLRKPTRVLILVDVAADANALNTATSRLGTAGLRFQAQDWVGVWTFPAPAALYTELRAVAPVTPSLDTTLIGISQVAAPTSLDSVVKHAIDQMGLSYDGGKLNAVLLVEMSPGRAFTPSDAAADAELMKYLQSQDATRFVRLFTIGPAGNARLQNLALAGRGFAYDPGTTTHLLNDVVSNF